MSRKKTLHGILHVELIVSFTSSVYKAVNESTEATVSLHVDRNVPCMSPGSIILWTRKEKPSGGGVDGSRRLGGREDGGGERGQGRR